MQSDATLTLTISKWNKSYLDNTKWRNCNLQSSMFSIHNLYILKSINLNLHISKALSLKRPFFELEVQCVAVNMGCY